MFKGIPGSFICYYYGYAKKKCNGTHLNISELPPECSSFVLDGIVIDRSVFTYNYTNRLKLTGIYEGLYVNILCPIKFNTQIIIMPRETKFYILDEMNELSKLNSSSKFLGLNRRNYMLQYVFRYYWFKRNM